ncbi:hypothetical protein FNV43_RR25812 [Rhamnella rubrinervis]|uniref:Lipoxygenase domain-containing protein n=1 Tax=Rhamnella rubrinervis TaxID=2594499 RepID=A0A8K0GJ20_9ROSA|nr:hypothetical protein FNV43_RR25812 [Rhamnella rubrinervis]
MLAVKPTSTSVKSNFPCDRLSPATSGAGKNGRVKKIHVPSSVSWAKPHGSVRAVISREDKTAKSPSTGTPLKSKDVSGSLPSSSSSSSGGIEVKAVVTIRKKMKEKINEKIEDQWEFFINGIGQGILIQLVSEEVDPVTNWGKSVVSSVRGWLPRPSNHSHIVEYASSFTVPHDFGNPGAILITNLRGKEFYLLEVVIHGNLSWWDLRREDCSSNGEDTMTDLGHKDDDLARPVIGGEQRPYPRRCRTGRPPAKSDRRSESRVEKPHPVYVPRDETFEEIKQNTFSAGRLKALLHNLIPSLAATLSSSDIPFKCFSDIDKLYNDGVLLKDDELNEFGKIPFAGNFMKQVLTVGDRLLKYEIPSIIKRDRFAWLRDNEFARQALAGLNPVNIELLKEFPILSKLDPTVYGPPESAITKELIDQELHRTSVDKAIEEKRLFILDFHDLLLPFIENMNSLPGRKAYASRTVFFYTPTGVLRPIAIELSLPPTPSSPQNKRVYTHGHDATEFWVWKLAKAHVCSSDTGIHQLVNHWGMAVEDPSMPCGVRLVIEDYPYAADGLLIWSAIKEWVESYVQHFYSDPNSINSDVELQAWWDEIKNKGHCDKRNEPWWPKLETKEDLSDILTTMIWVASGQHAAINFGQYPFGGYMPNRPTLMRKLIPREDDADYDKFMLNPQKTFLSSLPTQLQATKIMAVQDTLSTHSPDEEYLGQVNPLHTHWINDQEVLELFNKFSTQLEKIEETIHKRNKDIRLKNRSGAGVPPYELLLPSSGPGVTGRGIPNSISI